MRNIEAKFRLKDLGAAEDTATRIGYEPRGVLIQRDTFFNVANGKLKLREEPDGAALVFYRRGAHGALMLSDYEIVPVADPERTRAMLGAALGVLAEVCKKRTLLMRGNLRLHLDRVEQLGEFGEIEAVLGAGAGEPSSRTAVDELLTALGVRRDDLISVSYFELARDR